MTGARRRRSGFTIIEVLIVMAILTFLASLSFWGLSQIRLNMRIRQTHTLVQRVDSAIRGFHIQYMVWPTQTMLDGLAPPQLWYEFLNGGYIDEQLPNFMSKYENRGPWIELGNREVDAAGDIIDVWGTPLVIDVDAANNRILVYSFGPDLDSDNGLYRGDGSPEDDYITDEPIDDIPSR